MLFFTITKSLISSLFIVHSRFCWGVTSSSPLSHFLPLPGKVVSGKSEGLSETQHLLLWNEESTTPPSNTLSWGLNEIMNNWCIVALLEPSGHVINIPFSRAWRIYQSHPGGGCYWKCICLRSSLKDSDSEMWAGDEQRCWKGSLSDADIYLGLRKIALGFLRDLAEKQLNRGEQKEREKLMDWSST